VPWAATAGRPQPDGLLPAWRSLARSAHGGRVVVVAVTAPAFEPGNGRVSLDKVTLGKMSSTLMAVFLCPKAGETALDANATQTMKKCKWCAQTQHATELWLFGGIQTRESVMCSFAQCLASAVSGCPLLCSVSTSPCPLARQQKRITCRSDTFCRLCSLVHGPACNTRILSFPCSCIWRCRLRPYHNGLLCSTPCTAQHRGLHQQIPPNKSWNQ
jgi:hypothetical protein